MIKELTQTDKTEHVLVHVLVKYINMYLNEQSKKVKLLSTTDYNFLLVRIFLQVMAELKTLLLINQHLIL